MLSHYDRNPAALQDSISVSIVSYDFTRLYLYVKPDHERNDSKDRNQHGRVLTAGALNESSALPFRLLHFDASSGRVVLQIGEPFSPP